MPGPACDAQAMTFTSSAIARVFARYESDFGTLFFRRQTPTVGANRIAWLNCLEAESSIECSDAHVRIWDDPDQPRRSADVRGDRRYDIFGAHAIGMRGLGVLWGYGTRDELETAGADQLVESAGDLAGTVLSMIGVKSTH